MDNSKSIPIRSSEITTESTYFNRRQFMRGFGTAAAASLLAACGVAPAQETKSALAETKGTASSSATATSGKADELGAALTSYQDVTHYNNFYEFTTDKEGVAAYEGKLTVQPWSIEVSGLVQNPKIYALEDILRKYPWEERVYRMRCVEGWSMVIPWLGFPLAKLLKDAGPSGSARYVSFQTLMRPDEMPGQQYPSFPWPYTEGLRLDEALNDLTLLSGGLYGKELLTQNGAPLRLVVPWKYGFKSIKSIVKIELVEEQPATLWNAIAPNEYGFYSNVNPDRPHPRWSQASERRIGELSRRKTLMFNGYAEQVAELYKDMDLAQYY